ncbi:MAG: putative gamma-glutamyltransferase YwrD [Verrucomicrobia subdivision 3 bacterium]|nr:putative gamma-glutamyltransferase YwrD [Limisphaerales bacterium]MCS1416694.1 putative gamma-glutamyltransferase YwrD [Limisphaerales bacterium]
MWEGAGPKKAVQKVATGRLTGNSDIVCLTSAEGEGNMVSFIQELYHGWVSRYVPDGLGVAMENRDQLFSFNPEDINKLEPHKRPFCTVIPGFLTKNG